MSKSGKRIAIVQTAVGSKCGGRGGQKVQVQSVNLLIGKA